MPIYEYRCEACGEPHEALQRIADDPLTTCPACGEARLRKLISAAGFRLAGSGWYETDFKGQDRQRNVAGKDEPKKAEGSKEPKKEAKKEAKASSGSGSEGASAS